MQETELRLDLLKFFDELDESIMRGQYDETRENIEEFRQYIKGTTKIETNSNQAI